MILPSELAVQMLSWHEELVTVVVAEPSSVIVYVELGVRSPTVYIVVVAVVLEAVHCLVVPQVMLEMFNHSGLVVEAS